MIAVEQKRQADRLSKESEDCKLKLEELKQVVVSYQGYADTSPLRYDNFVFENDAVKLLKKQLKLEKMLAKHAKKAVKVEALRNSLLHKELFYWKQECLALQQFLDSSSSLGGEGTCKPEKIRTQTFKTKEICSDECHRQSEIGIDSGLNPPCGDSNQKLFSSAKNSTLTSFSDRSLVGSQERGTVSVATLSKIGGDISDLKNCSPL